ncbi:MAG: hypothetical protein AB7O32_10170 [Vicinamibacterales bacterium]
MMELAGLRPGQVRAVRGYADRQLQMPDLPLDPRNRRVSIVVRSEATRTIEDSLRDPVKPVTEEPAGVPELPVSKEPAPAEPKRTRASH